MNYGKEIKWTILDNGCWNCISHSTDYSGYPRLVRNGRVENMSRYIFKKYNGELPDNLIVRHTCDNPTCINPKHLISGTYKENSHDRDVRKRAAIGERHGKAKLTENIVREIRKDTEHTLMELAQIYGVGFTTVRYAKNGYHWKHVQ